MTREEARIIALKQVEDAIKKYGENACYFRAPKIGKHSWTYKEAKESIIKDQCLEDTNENLIDDVLRLHTAVEKKCSQYMTENLID